MYTWTEKERQGGEGKRREGASFWALPFQSRVSGAAPRTLPPAQLSRKLLFSCCGWFIQPRERPRTIQVFHQAVPSNPTGQIFLEISSRNYDHKQNYKSYWPSGSSCKIGLISEWSLRPQRSWGEPLGPCHHSPPGSLHWGSTVQRDRASFPDPLASGKTREDVRAASSQPPVKIISMPRDWATPLARSPLPVTTTQSILKPYWGR